MSENRALQAHPPWRQLLIVAVALPGVILLAVLAFAWPAARTAPRQLPVGIVGTGQAAEQVVRGLTGSRPGAFEFHLYADDRAAREAIVDRDVYGAFEVGRGGVAVLEASAAGPTVAQLLTSVGQQLATQADGSLGPARAVDVVPTSPSDPRGAVLSAALLPMTICSVIIAAVIGLVLAFRPAWRQLVALVVVSAAAALGAYAIAQGFLGALPHQPLATWGALALLLLAISSTTAGLIALIGSAGLGVSAALMVFMGNPFSGVTSAPDLLPGAVRRIGEWLPPGAGASLLRSTAYFDGHGAADQLAVLAAWCVLGLAAVVVGHHPAIRFAASPDRLERSDRPAHASVAAG